MLSFKQFLFEGGKATSKYNTKRVDKKDILEVLSELSKMFNISVDELKNQLLGSTPLTLSGVKDSSGDIDIAFLISEKDEVIKKLENKVKEEPYITMGSVYSYPFPINGKKIQLDIMFVNDLDWAKHSYYTDPDSKYNSSIRNEFLHSLLKFSQTPGEDYKLKDENGHTILKAVKVYKLDGGIERTFKMAKKKKDGTTYSKTLENVSPEDIKKELKSLGKKVNFKDSKDTNSNFDDFAKKVLCVKADEISSVEKIIPLIKKRDDADEILKDVKSSLEKRGFEIPKELVF